MARKKPPPQPNLDDPDQTTDLESRGWISTPGSTCFSAVRVEGSMTQGAVTVYVEFRKSGRVYSYHGVPQDVVLDFLAAPSRGRFYNFEMKGVFRSRYVG